MRAVVVVLVGGNVPHRLHRLHRLIDRAAEADHLVSAPMSVPAVSVSHTNTA